MAKNTRKEGRKGIEIYDDKNRTYVTTEKLGRRCRTCLLQDGTINVFTTQHNMILYSDLFSKFSLCEMCPSDGLPQTICATCAKFLINLHTFYDQIQQSLLTLTFARGQFNNLNVVPVLLPRIGNTNDEHDDIFNKSGTDIDKDDDDDENEDKHFSEKNIANSYEVDMNSNESNFEITDETIEERINGVDENLNIDNETIKIAFLGSDENTSIFEGSDESTRSAFEGGDFEEFFTSNGHKHFDKIGEEITELDNNIDENIEESSYTNKTSNNIVERIPPLGNSRGGDINSDYDRIKSTVIMALNVGSEYKINEDLVTSQELMRKQSDSEITCSICNQTFKTRTEYVRHKRSKSEREMRRKTTCSVCLTPIAFYKMGEHIKLHERHTNEDKIEIIIIDCEDVERIENTKMLDHSYAKKGQKYTCIVCSLKFTDCNDYFKHMKDERDKRQKRDCPICDNKIPHFRMESHINSHLNKTIGNNGNSLEIVEYTCKFCNLKFSSQIQYILHMKQEDKNRIAQIRSNKVIKKITCSVCNKLLSKYKMKRHMMNVHKKKEHISNVGGRTLRSQISIPQKPKFLCQECGITLHSQEKFDYHQKRKHLGFKPYQCRICGKRFGKTDILRDHLRSHTGERPFLCATCGKAFVQPAHLRTHTRLAHTKEKPFCCEICGKTFALKNYYTEHMNLHIPGKPYNQCKICNKSFAQIKPHMRRHEEKLRPHEEKRPPQPKLCKICNTIVENPIAHSRTHLKKHPCQVCNRSYFSKTILEDHMYVHTGISRLDLKCDICNKSFRKKLNLKVHQRIHTGERPYKCEECGSAFIQYTHLTIHKRIHTGEKPYACPYCSKRFNMTGTLRDHVMIHTGERPHVCEYCSKGFISSSGLKKHISVHEKNCN